MSCAGDGGLLAATCGASASRVTSWQRGRPFTTGEKENGGKWITTKNGRRVMKLSLTKQGRQRYWRAPRPRPRPHRRQRRNVVKEIVQSALSPAETGAAANSKDSAQVIMVLQTSLRSALLRMEAAEKWREKSGVMGVHRNPELRRTGGLQVENPPTLPALGIQLPLGVSAQGKPGIETGRTQGQSGPGDMVGWLVRGPEAPQQQAQHGLNKSGDSSTERTVKQHRSASPLHLCAVQPPAPDSEELLTAAAAQVEQLKAQRTKQASNAAAYQQAAAVQVAQLKAQLAEQASTAAVCQQAAAAQGAQLKAQLAEQASNAAAGQQEAAAQVAQLKVQLTEQASNAAAYQQAAAVQVAQLKAQLAEQASTAAACQQAAVAQGAQLKAAHRQARGASFLRFDYEQAAAQVGHLKVQLTEQALSAAACQQAAAAQVAQLRAEQLETVLLLAKQLETMQTLRDIWAEDLVKFCSKIHVKLHKCEDAHDEMSERKRFRAYGKLHDFITTHIDYLCSTVLAD